MPSWTRSAASGRALRRLRRRRPCRALFAATYPDRVRARSSSTAPTHACCARRTSPAALPERVLDRWAETMLERVGRFRRPGPIGRRARSTTPRSRTGGRGCLRQGTSPRGTIDLIDLYRQIDMRAVLPSIHVPTLVLHRRDDRMMPRRAWPLPRRADPRRALRRAARRAITCRGWRRRRSPRRDRGVPDRHPPTPASPIACWRRCSSPTSSARPSGRRARRPSLARPARERITRSSAPSCARLPRPRDRHPATASSRPSTAPPARSAARWRSRDAVQCARHRDPGRRPHRRVRALDRGRSAASPSTSARASRRAGRAQARCSSSSTVKDLVVGSGHRVRGSRRARPEGRTRTVAAVRGARHSVTVEPHGALSVRARW